MMNIFFERAFDFKRNISLIIFSGIYISRIFKLFLLYFQFYMVK